MAIVKKQEPTSTGLVPAFNPIYIVLDSDNRSKKNFSYLVDMGVDRWEPDSSDITTFNDREKLRLSGSSNNTHKFNTGEIIYLEGGSHAGKTRIVDTPDNKTIITNVNTSNASTPNSVYHIYRNEVKPRPADGYALLDLKDIGSFLVKENYDPDLTGVTTNPDYIKAARIRYHEQFTEFWDFYDNQFNSGSVGFTGSTQHNLNVGDEIYIEQDKSDSYIDVAEFRTLDDAIILDGDRTGLYEVGDVIKTQGANNSQNNVEAEITDPPFTFNSPTQTGLLVNVNLVDENPTPGEISFPVPPYNGRAKITSVVNNQYIVTNKPFAYSTPPIGGTIKLANNQKKINKDAAGNDLIYVFDGALTNKDDRNWNDGDYIMDSIIDGKFLTSYQTSHVPFSGSAKMNFISVDGGNYDDSPQFVKVTTTNSNSTNGEYLMSIPEFDDPEDIYNSHTVHCGPHELNRVDQNTVTASTGTFPIIKSDTQSYELGVLLGDMTSITSTERKFKIYENSNDVDCGPYPLKRLVYKDRFGSYDGYTFHLLKQGEIQYNRSRFEDGGYDLNGNNIDKRSHKKGHKQLYVDQTEQITLNTGYIDTNEFERVKELLNSPDVYYEFHYGERVGVILTTEDVSIISDNERNLKQVEITFELSDNDIRQRN